MKKLLALVLALVMTLGLATVGTNAAFVDQTDVDASAYSDAIQVLNGMKVFQGYKNGAEDGKFMPQNKITRAQVAAIIYRIYTGDTTDAKIKNYIDLANFSDVKSTDWYAGYIGYCANAQFIKGYGDGTFGPNDQVTGYQTLAMILRAVGYDKNHEFEGKGYEVEVARVAQQLGMLDAVKAEDLNLPINREAVAQILFDAVQVPTVTYTPAFGYNQFKTDNLMTLAQKNASLGWINFRLTCDLNEDDEWGRPGYRWYGEYNQGATVDDEQVAYNNGDYGVYTYGNNDTDYARIAYEPDAVYYTDVTECDVAHDVNQGNTVVNYETIVNAQTAVTYAVQPTDTATKIGAPGRLTEVYLNYDGASDRIVMIDTFLARVNNVRDAQFDANGHRTLQSRIGLTIYTGQTTGIETTVAGTLVAGTRTETRNYFMQNGSTNYEYKVGDYVLLNAPTDGSALPAVTRLLAGNAQNRPGSAVDFAVTAGILDDPAEIIGQPTSITGAQTVLHNYDGRHTVGGTTYNDSLELHLDQAGQQVTNHEWLFQTTADGAKWLIGIVDVATVYSYGVINNIWWAGDATNGSGAAMADIRYMDGTTGTVTLANVAINRGDNTAAAGTFGTPVYDVSGVGAPLTMTFTQRANTAALPTTNVNNPALGTDGVLHVATNRDANRAADVNGIVRTNLFRFETLANGTVSAVEVDTLRGEATLQNAAATAINRNVANNGAMIAPVNANTVFLFRNADGSYTSVTGFANLPAPSYNAGEVDYVVGADGFASFVYVTALPTNAVSSSLFYLTSTSVQLDVDTATGATNGWFLTGYLDGVYSERALRIPNTVNGTAIKNFIINGNVGKMWVVGLVNGIANDLYDADGATTVALVRNAATGVFAGGSYLFDTVTSVPAANPGNVRVTLNTPFNLNNLVPAQTNYANMSVTMTRGQNPLAGASVSFNAVTGAAETFTGADGWTYTITGVTPKTVGGVDAAWAADMSAMDVVLVYSTPAATSRVVREAYVIAAPANVGAVNVALTSSANAATVATVGAVGDTITLTANVGMGAMTATAPLGRALLAHETATYQWYRDNDNSGTVSAGDTAVDANDNALATAAPSVLAKTLTVDTSAAAVRNYICEITVWDNSNVSPVRLGTAVAGADACRNVTIAVAPTTGTTAVTTVTVNGINLPAAGVAKNATTTVNAAAPSVDSGLALKAAVANANSITLSSIGGGAAGITGANVATTGATNAAVYVYANAAAIEAAYTTGLAATAGEVAAAGVAISAGNYVVIAVNGTTAGNAGIEYIVYAVTAG